MRHRVVATAALVVHVMSQPVFAACGSSEEASDTIVRGRFLRCEDARPYLESGGAYRAYERDLESERARRGPESQARLLEVLEDSILSPDYEARVVVVAVESYATIVPWLGQGPAEFKDQPRPFSERIRYWWSASVEQCEALSEGSQIDLWVHAECCDSFQFGAPTCIIGMTNAEPVPEAMIDAVSQAFDSQA